jgi:hypothetical protein
MIQEKLSLKTLNQMFGKSAFTKLFHLFVEVLNIRRRNCWQLCFKIQNWDTLHNLYSKSKLTIHIEGSLELNEIVLDNHPGKVKNKLSVTQLLMIFHSSVPL